MSPFMIMSVPVFAFRPYACTHKPPSRRGNSPHGALDGPSKTDKAACVSCTGLVAPCDVRLYPHATCDGRLLRKAAPHRQTASVCCSTIVPCTTGTWPTTADLAFSTSAAAALSASARPASYAAETAFAWSDADVLGVDASLVPPLHENRALQYVLIAKGRARTTASTKKQPLTGVHRHQMGWCFCTARPLPMAARSSMQPSPTAAPICVGPSSVVSQPSAHRPPMKMSTHTSCPLLSTFRCGILRPLDLRAEAMTRAGRGGCAAQGGPCVSCEAACVGMAWVSRGEKTRAARVPLRLWRRLVPSGHERGWSLTLAFRELPPVLPV